MNFWTTHCFFHDWGKWEEVSIPCLYSPYEGHSPISTNKQGQRRVCLCCGLIQQQPLRK